MATVTSILALTSKINSHIDKKSVMTADPNRLMLSTQLFEMYHTPYNETKKFQITVNCSTDLKYTVLTDLYALEFNTFNTKLMNNIINDEDPINTKSLRVLQIS
jgi:hypothetical protein